MTAPAVPNFRRGAEEAEKAGARKSYSRTGFLSIADGQSAVVRFLTDVTDWFTVLQHDMIPVRTDHGQKKWPEKMGATCRKDVAFRGMYDDCFICDHMKDPKGEPYKPKERTWALVLLRNVQTQGGQMVGVTNMMTEIEVDGVKRAVPRIEWANFAWSNFFGAVSNIASLYGTILLNDIRITRKGTGNDTDYYPVPYNPVTAIRKNPDGTPVLDDQGNPLPPEDFDLRKPYFMEEFAPFMPSISDMLIERSSDDFYAKFFDTRVPFPADKIRGEGTDGGGEAPAQAEPDAAALADMASRIASYGAPSPAPVPQPPT